MIKFNNFPPTSPEDIELNPDFVVIIKDYDRYKGEDINRMFVLGRALGSLLVANIPNATEDLVVEYADKLMRGIDESAKDVFDIRDLYEGTGPVLDGAIWSVRHYPSEQEIKV